MPSLQGLILPRLDLSKRSLERFATFALIIELLCYVLGRMENREGGLRMGVGKGD